MMVRFDAGGQIADIAEMASGGHWETGRELYSAWKNSMVRKTVDLHALPLFAVSFVEQMRKSVQI